MRRLLEAVVLAGTLGMWTKLSSIMCATEHMLLCVCSVCLVACCTDVCIRKGGGAERKRGGADAPVYIGTHGGVALFPSE